MRWQAKRLSVRGESGNNGIQTNGNNKRQQPQEREYWPDPSCGIHPGDVKTRIINGSMTKQGDIPWIVRFDTLPDHNHYKTCGGTIVNEWLVITAKHCQIEPGVDIILILAGD